MTRFDEARNPGMRYVLHSRCKDEERLAMRDPMTLIEYKKLCSDENSLRHKELHRIRLLAQGTKAKYRRIYAEIGSEVMYIDLLRWLVTFCRSKCRESLSLSEEKEIILERCTAIAAAIGV